MDHYEYKADQQQGLEAGGVMTGAVEAAQYSPAQYSPAQYSSPPPLYHHDTGLQPASVAGHQHHRATWKHQKPEGITRNCHAAQESHIEAPETQHSISNTAEI